MYNRMLGASSLAQQPGYISNDPMDGGPAQGQPSYGGRAFPPLPGHKPPLPQGGGQSEGGPPVGMTPTAQPSGGPPMTPPAGGQPPQMPPQGAMPPGAMPQGVGQNVVQQNGQSPPMTDEQRKMLAQMLSKPATNQQEGFQRLGQGLGAAFGQWMRPAGPPQAQPQSPAGGGGPVG